MRKSKAEAAQTRRRIVEVAASAFKANGIHATGVAEIMAAAGLTHGAFYRHFASKEQLVTEACAASMDILVEAAEEAAREGPEAFLQYLGDFFTTEAREELLGGCCLVAMGSELARSDAETRRVATRGFQGLIDIVARYNHPGDAPSARADAIFTLSSMIGAVSIAKIVDDPKLANQILEVAKNRLVEWQDSTGKLVPKAQLIEGLEQASAH